MGQGLVQRSIVNGEQRLRLNSAESRLRLQTIVRLRWFAVVGQLAAIGFVYLVLGYDMPVGTCLTIIALSAWLNVFLRIKYPARHRLGARFASLLLAYDVVQLSALLYLTGGIENPFTVLVVAPVTVSAATLPPRNTIILGAFALAASALLVPFHLRLPWRSGEMISLPLLYKLGILAAIAACTIFLALYAFRLSKEARQMSAALAATEHILAREQQLHALDGLAAAAAHELGTPLATIVLVTKEMERALAKDHPFAEDVQLLRSQAARCREILQKLTRSPSERDPLHASLSVTQLIDEAAAPYRALPGRVEIKTGPGEGVAAQAASEPIGERRPGVIYGLGNLIENAVDFARDKVLIEARWTEHEVSIVVTDDGPGFPPDLLDTLGEPYVTTRSGERHVRRARGDNAGLGLGFFIAKTLLERSGAELMLANRDAPHQGAIVRVIWPRDTFEMAGNESGELFDKRWSRTPGSTSQIVKGAV